MAERSKAAAVAIGAAGGSVVTYLLTKAGEARAAEPPEGMDQATWDMIVAMLEGQAQLIASVDNLTATLGGVPAGAGEDPFASTRTFTTGQVICTNLNQGFQLPSIPIPKNKQIVVKALPGNVGWVFVASMQSDSQNVNVAYPLLPQEGIGLFVKNANVIWVMAPPPPLGALNDGIAYLVEQE